MTMSANSLAQGLNQGVQLGTQIAANRRSQKAQDAIFADRATTSSIAALDSLAEDYGYDMDAATDSPLFLQ